MAPKAKRKQKTKSVNSRAKKSGKLLAPKFFDCLKEFNTTNTRNALRAAQLTIAPYISDSGREFQLRGKTFCLSTDAPRPIILAATFISIVDQSEKIFQGNDVEEQIEVAMSIGLLSIPILHSCGTGKTLSEAIDIFLKDQDARRRGGQSRAKWTPDVQRLASKFFADAKRGGHTSNEAAVLRTKANLAKLGHKIGRTTLWTYLVEKPAKS